MDNIEKLAAALVQVQAKIKVAKKDKLNTFFKAKYADLGAVWEAVHEALTEEKIAVVQRPTFRDGLFFCTTDLIHESGQSMSGEYLVRPIKDDPQGYGSAFTYARRYSLASMVGVIQEDDDARIASTTRGPKADTSKLAAKLAPKITAKEASDLYAACKENGVSNEKIVAFLKEQYKIAASKDIKKADYDAIMLWVTSQEPG